MNVYTKLYHVLYYLEVLAKLLNAEIRRPLPAKHGRKHLPPCPTCRAAFAVKSRRAAGLPIVYLALQGA